MKDIGLMMIHLMVTVAKLFGPGGARAVVPDNILLNDQLIVLRRPRMVRKLSPLETAAIPRPLRLPSSLLSAHLRHAEYRTLGPMNTLPLQFLMLIFAGWVNRSHQDVIEYLEEENRVLREQLGGKRLLFTNRQRRRLAAKAKAIGRNRLFEIRTLVTPDTLLRWYRTLIAKKYDGSMPPTRVAPRQPPRSSS